MKKKISIIVSIILMTIVSLTTIIKAAEVSVSLSPDKEKVEQAGEVKVSIVVNNFTRTGSQKAIEAKIGYDSEKIEYKGIE